MNTNVVTALIVLAATILAGSDILKAELLTNFEVMPRKASPGQDVILQVNNTGLVQADNVVLLIIANGTINNFTDICAEGDIQQLDDNVLVAEFSRMSPNMICNFELSVSEPVHFEPTISSDNRVTLWRGSPTWSWAVGGFLFLLAVEVVAIIILIKKLWLEREWLHMMMFSLVHKKKFVKTGAVSKTLIFVNQEYNLSINVMDALILELIYYKKITMAQLKKHSGLPMWQIKYSIRKMRQHELVLPDSMKLNETLDAHFYNLFEGI